jgi:two-component system, cell cycle sensor histidine kinase and response regulator CckA
MVNDSDNPRAPWPDQNSQLLEKQWLELTFNSVADCLFLLSVEPDECYRFVSVNDAFLVVTGLKKEQVTGKRVEEVIPEPALSFVLGKYREALHENRSIKWEEVSDYPAGRRVGEVIVTPLVYETTGRKYLVGAVHDISDLRAEQEALKKTVEMLNVALRTTHEAFVFLRLRDERILDANDGWLKIVGYEREEVIGKTSAEINTWVYREDQERFAAAMQEQGSVRDFEITYRHKSGELRKASFSAEVIDMGGEPCAFIIGRDVTERKRAEEARRASEAELRALFAAMSDVIFVIDGEGRHLKVAPTNPDILYRPPDEVVGKTMRDIFPEPTASLFLDRIQQALTARHRVSVEYSLNIKGRELWFIATIAPMSENTVIWVARDITDIREAERALRESEKLYRDTVENANDIIYTVDLNGGYLSVNRAGERIIGYTRDEILQMNFTDIIAPEYLDTVLQNIGKKVAGGGETVYELEVITKDGRRVMVEINSRLLEREGVPIAVLGIARDITERKRAEEKLDQIEEQLRQSQKLESIGLLAGGIAHDFNNMLTAINGYSDLILRKLNEDDPLRSKIEEIRKASERAGELTYQLLAFSRKQILRPKPLNINEIVSDVSRMLQRLIGEDIDMRAILNERLGQVETDRGQITQVLMNLAVNARDAMPRGGKLTIETDNVLLDEVYVQQHATVTPGRYVMLAVSDTGIGMDAETRERIFEPFFTTKEVGAGTGMGLATVYGIVKQSGGHIWVYSELNQGTTFKIYLPRINKESERLDEETSDMVLPAGTEKILLVEDEELVRNLIKQILETCGYEVHETANGAEAVKLCEGTGYDFDLLITDVVMPEMGGRELVKWLSASLPSLRALYMSGYTDKAIVHHGILKEGTNFIQKPFTPEAFARKVRDVLDAPR